VGNAYKDFRDDAIHGVMDTMHSRLRNGGGVKLLGYNDRTKPALDYGPGTPARIKSVKESHKRLNIDGMPK
jgi:hypothetical protein